MSVSAPMNSHRAQPRLGAIIVKSNPAKQINCSAQQKEQQPARRMRNTPGVHGDDDDEKHTWRLSGKSILVQSSYFSAPTILAYVSCFYGAQ